MNELLKRAARCGSSTGAARLISKAGGLVAGGAARDIYLGENPNDIDLFIPKGSANRWYKALRAAGFKQNRRQFIADGGIKIDVVETEHKTAQDVVGSFDCNICRWYLHDGKPISIDESTKRATTNKVATFFPELDLFGTSPKRAQKLRDNGWVTETVKTAQGSDWLSALGLSEAPTEESTEEECPQCKRMKDVGQSCWWCGYEEEEIAKSWGRESARGLLNRIAKWYFTTDAGKNFDPDKLPITKVSNKKTDYSDDIWVKLMTDAIMSFNQGLEQIIDPEARRASSDRVLFEDAVSLVGSEAFNTIAFLVSAAGTDTQVRRELDVIYQQVDPTTLLKTIEDKQTYNQAAQIIANETFFWDSQPQVFDAHKQLQAMSTTQGLSPELARYIGAISAMYMRRADELTRESGAQPSTPGGDLPTGVSIQGRRKHVRCARSFLRNVD